MDYLCDNAMFKSSMFPNSLKVADVTPLHKKGKKVLKEDNRSVSILPTLPKIFEMMMFAQISSFFDYVFLKFQCGFRKGSSTQHCKLKMLKKWKNMSVKEALLIYFSKAFDCLDHKLLTAKLNAYSFNLPALRLIHDYLSNKKQGIKIEDNYTTWMGIVFGITQGSILKPLLFNVFLVGLFFIISNVNITSYADDNTSYIAADNIGDLVKSKEEASTALFQ